MDNEVKKQSVVDKKENMQVENLDAKKVEGSQEETKAPENSKNTTKPKAKEVLVTSGINKFEDPFLAQKRFKRRSFDNFEEVVLQIRRVIKVTKGGRQFRFGALVVVGDKKGQVGYGTAKAKEVPDAIKKAIADAKKNLIYVHIDKSSKTVYHEWKGRKGATEVLLMPAGKGKGLIASETVRSVVELVGIQNIYSKVIGSNNKYNVVAATIDALTKIKSDKYIAYLKSDQKSNPIFDNKRKPVIFQKKPNNRFNKRGGFKSKNPNFKPNNKNGTANSNFKPGFKKENSYAENKTNFNTATPNSKTNNQQNLNNTGGDK